MRQNWEGEFSFRGTWRSKRMRLVLARLKLRSSEMSELLYMHLEIMEPRHLCGLETEVMTEKVTENWVLGGDHHARSQPRSTWVLALIFFFLDLFTCSLGEMMTLRHAFNFCKQHPKIQSGLYFQMFCFTRRPNVVGANSEKENCCGDLSHYLG